MDTAEWQRRFYEPRFARHGISPQAVGYTDAETQAERFVRLARLFYGAQGLNSLHEIGCGLGDFGAWLAMNHVPCEYSGSDVVPAFVETCSKRFPGGRFLLRDITRRDSSASIAPVGDPDSSYDYLVLSGTFNARFEGVAQFAHDMMDAMYAMCRRGIAVNFLTTYADRERMDPDLYYVDPRAAFDYAASRLSRHVELDAAGPLFEFTLRVYRPEYVQSQYATPAFQRYFRSMTPRASLRMDRST